MRRRMSISVTPIFSFSAMRSKMNVPLMRSRALCAALPTRSFSCSLLIFLHDFIEDALRLLPHEVCRQLAFHLRGEVRHHAAALRSIRLALLLPHEFLARDRAKLRERLALRHGLGECVIHLGQRALL